MNYISNLIKEKNKYFHILFLLLILFFSYKQLYNNMNNIHMITFFILAIILIINDNLRKNCKTNFKDWHYYSLILSIILASILKYLAPTLLVINFYYFIIVMEIFNYNKNKLIFILLHFVLYLAILVLEVQVTAIPDKINVIEVGAVIYCSVIYIIYIFHTNKIEKEQIKNLNEKLKESNVKLHEYSQKIEELSIARERERVAQELHDSLGHSLMALIMHLEFAEKSFTVSPEKAQKVIVKARDIAKSSTSDLRKAVNALKEERYIEGLRNSINELIDNFSRLGDIKIDLNMNKDLETLNPDLKLCIYKTVRESLTNGIKHGKATKFNLELLVEKDKLILISRDNGTGCDKISKSNGLLGIEDRVRALGGSVDFTSKHGGFETKVKVPIYQKNEVNKMIL